MLVRVAVEVVPGVIVPPPVVVRVRHQPPCICPLSNPTSSTTYRLQFPLGLVPLNTDRVVPYGAGGAGAGKGSGLGVQLVGRYVPVALAAVHDITPPVSSKVYVTPFRAALPPTSDMSSTL